MNRMQRKFSADSEVSIHGENGVFIYKTCFIWAPWASCQARVLSPPFCRQRRLSIGYWKRKIQLTPMYENLRITLYQWRTQEFCSGGGSTNSVEDRGQRERGSGDSSPPSQGFWRQL